MFEQHPQFAAMREREGEIQPRIKLTEESGKAIDRIARDHNVSPREALVELARAGFVIEAVNHGGGQVYHVDKKGKRTPFALQIKKRLNFSFGPKSSERATIPPSITQRNKISSYFLPQTRQSPM